MLQDPTMGYTHTFRKVPMFRIYPSQWDQDLAAETFPAGHGSSHEEWYYHVASILFLQWETALKGHLATKALAPRVSRAHWTERQSKQPSCFYCEMNVDIRTASYLLSFVLYSYDTLDNIWVWAAFYCSCMLIRCGVFFSYYWVPFYVAAFILISYSNSVLSK